MTRDCRTLVPSSKTSMLCYETITASHRQGHSLRISNVYRKPSLCLSRCLRPPLIIEQKHTIILAHGLLGFDELRLAGRFLPGIQYWRGITDALSKKGIEVIVAAVPPSGSIEARAQRLADSIAEKAGGKDVNIIA